MIFWQWWKTRPRWLQSTIRTVLGVITITGAGYLGFQLMGLLIAGNANIGIYSARLWQTAGAIVIMSAVLGGIGEGNRRAMRKRNRHGGSNGNTAIN